MSYLVDTNIISEVRKRDQCNPNVAAWYASIDDADIYLSVLVLGAIRKGIERARPNDPARARALVACCRWTNWLPTQFSARAPIAPRISLWRFKPSRSGLSRLKHPTNRRWRKPILPTQMRAARCSVKSINSIPACGRRRGPRKSDLDGVFSTTPWRAAWSNGRSRLPPMCRSRPACLSAFRMSPRPRKASCTFPALRRSAA